MPHALGGSMARARIAAWSHLIRSGLDVPKRSGWDDPIRSVLNDPTRSGYSHGARGSQFGQPAEAASGRSRR